MVVVGNMGFCSCFYFVGDFFVSVVGAILRRHYGINFLNTHPKQCGLMFCLYRFFLQSDKFEKNQTEKTIKLGICMENLSSL